jgi:hypothetical protein
VAGINALPLMPWAGSKTGPLAFSVKAEGSQVGLELLLFFRGGLCAINRGDLFYLRNKFEFISILF